jgi:hypothetical protein
MCPDRIITIRMSTSVHAYSSCGGDMLKKLQSEANTQWMLTCYSSYCSWNLYAIRFAGPKNAPWCINVNKKLGRDPPSHWSSRDLTSRRRVISSCKFAISVNFTVNEKGCVQQHTTYPQQHAEGSAEFMPKSLRIRWGEGNVVSHLHSSYPPR